MIEKSEIGLQLGDVKAHLAPWRGGLVTTLQVGGVDLLYLDRQTLEDESLGIRGGIPILFPFASFLQDGVLQASGTKIPMHGFGRSKSWEVVASGPGQASLLLKADEGTKAVYPWDFRVVQHCLLTGRGIHLELTMENLSETPMPVAPGWHPYFRCAAQDKVRVVGDFDSWKSGLLRDSDDVNVGVLPPADSRMRFQIPQIGNILITCSPEMRHLHVWTVQGRPFVCLEPFSGPPNFINTPDSLKIPGHSARTLWMRIELE